MDGQFGSVLSRTLWSMDDRCDLMDAKHRAILINSRGFRMPPRSPFLRNAAICGAFAGLLLLVLMVLTSYLGKNSDLVSLLRMLVGATIGVAIVWLVCGVARKLLGR